MLVVAAVFIFLLIVGVPIAFVLGSTALLHLLTIDNPVYFNVVIQRLFSGVNSYSLMAIPFFVLAGELMNRGKVTEKLVDFTRELVGFVNGGLAYVTVIVAMLLSAILGSANAVAAILCSIMVFEMKKDGYDEEFSVSLIASSSIIGPIIPPSIIFILYGVLTGTSVSALFLAGIVPGVLLGIAYMLIARYYTKKNNYPKSKEKFEPKKIIVAFVKAIPALLIPFIIVGGVLSGFFTPTEAGAVAVFMAFFSGFFLYKSLKLRELPQVLYNTGIITAGIMLIVAFGNIFGWTLATDKIPQLLSDTILSITNQPLLVLFLIIIGMVFVGMVMEAFAIMVIFIPVLNPLTAAVGIDPIHFGVVFSLLIAVALITPPIGMVLFVTSNITNVPLSKINKSIIPYAIVSFIVILIITIFPETVLFLPKLFMK